MMFEDLSKRIFRRSRLECSHPDPVHPVFEHDGHLFARFAWPLG